MLTFSVVINTYNRAQTVADAISGALAIDYPSYEVIVVNGPSTDRTQDIAKSFGTRIKYAECSDINLSTSRNVGIANASGDVVAFIDDDAVPHPSWLTHLASGYSDPKVGAVGGFTLDNSGRHFQAKKTICDRYGNPYEIPTIIDERQFNFPGTPFYASLLGTNSSFRSDVLRTVGGFDDVYAYYLDETDLCLRIVDAGYQVIYAPDAIVFHQFAASHIRDEQRIARTFYPSAVSKAYFICRHGLPVSLENAAREIDRYEQELRRSTTWFFDEGVISLAHKKNLDLDLAAGVALGRARALEKSCKSVGDLSLRDLPIGRFLERQGERLRIALVSQGYPPHNDTGIPRWTKLLAEGLAARGNNVHVITRDDVSPSIRYQDGIWEHRVRADPASAGTELLVAEHSIPGSVAAWAAAVREELLSLGSFGIDVVSCPIWDIEGVGVLGLNVPLVVSLHTTYALAKPFKEEWNARPIFEHLHVTPVIAKEREMLMSADALLANSNAIVLDIENAYGLSLGDRPDVVAHGTCDPLDNRRKDFRERRPCNRLRVGFVGRFEKRKGFDIAAEVFDRLLNQTLDIEIVIAGDDQAKLLASRSDDTNIRTILAHKNVHFMGMVSRSELDDIYCSCDVVIVPSRYESFGLVAIEAMAAGSVVLALAVGGLKEVIDDGVSGYLIEPGGECVEGFVGKIATLAKDRTLLKQVSGQARRRYLEHFTVSAMAAEAEEVYKSVARRGKTSG